MSLHAFYYEIKKKSDGEFEITMLDAPKLGTELHFEKSIFSDQAIYEQFNPTTPTRTHFPVFPTYKNGSHSFFQVLKFFKSSTYIVLIDVNRIQAQNSTIDFSQIKYGNKEDKDIINTFLLLSFLNQEIYPQLYEKRNTFFIEFLTNLCKSERFKQNTEKVICKFDYFYAQRSYSIQTQLYLYLLIDTYSNTIELSPDENQKLNEALGQSGLIPHIQSNPHLFYFSVFFIFQMIPLDHSAPLFGPFTYRLSLFPTIESKGLLKTIQEFRPMGNIEDHVYALICTLAFYLKNSQGETFEDFVSTFQNPNRNIKIQYSTTTFDAILFEVIAKMLAVIDVNSRTSFLSKFVYILKAYLPDNCWGFFVERYLFTSIIFEPAINDIVSRNKLLDELLITNPLTFASIFNSVVETIFKPTDNEIKRYSVYKQNLSNRPICQLLNAINSPMRNRYFSIPLTISLLTEMTFIDFISLNNEDYEALNNFYKNYTISYQDYIRHESISFKKKFETIFRKFFDPIMNIDTKQPFLLTVGDTDFDIVDSQLTRIYRMVSNNKTGLFNLITSVYGEEKLNLIQEYSTQIGGYIQNNRKAGLSLFSSLENIQASQPNTS